MKTPSENIRKLHRLLRSKPLEWTPHVLTRLQAGERVLRTEDEIVALLRTVPKKIVWGTLIELSYRTKYNLFTIVIKPTPESLRIVTFMEE